MHRRSPYPCDFPFSVLALLVLSVSAVAQHVGCFSKVLTEGQPGVVEIDGSTLCLGAGSNLVVFQLDSAGVPQVRSRLDMHHRIRDIALRGDEAFVLCESAGLSLVDVSDADNPRERFRLEIPGSVRALAAAGDQIAVASDELVLVHRDSSSSRLQMVNSYPLRANGITFTNWFLFAATSDSGVVVLDRNGLQRVGSLPGVMASDIASFDTLAFVTYADNPRLTVVSITRPDHPAILGTAFFDTTPQELKLDFQDSIICVTGASLGLATLRVAGSGQPALLARVGADTVSPQDVRMKEGFAYLACGSQGLRIMRMTNPATPWLQPFTYDEANEPGRVAVGAGVCLVANGGKGLTKLDVSEVRYPEEEQTARPVRGGYTQAVSLNGCLAYTAEGPATMRILGSCGPLETWYQQDSTGLRFNDIVVVGSHAYVADGTLGLRILDARDTTHYTPVFNVPTPGSSPADLCVAGGMAYLASPDGSVHLVDVHTPTQAAPVSSFPLPAHAVSVSGTLLYAAADSAGLVVLDVSVPQTPHILSSYVTAAPALDVWVSGHYAFVACGAAGLQIVDVSQPDDPQLSGGFDSDGYARFVTVAGDVAYLSDHADEANPGGLYLLDVSYYSGTNPTCLILACVPNGAMHSFLLSINPVANLVYNTLASYSDYGSGRVTYINPVGWQDMDGDARDDGRVDQNSLRLDSVRAEFMKLRADADWTMHPILYLVGNGSYDEFEIAQGVSLSSDTLAAWVNAIPVNPLSKLIIVMESCQSGSFIDELCAENRIIVTSTDAYQQAHFVGTRLFSTYFWEHADEPNTSVALAFQTAAEEFTLEVNGQTPQLCADGNAIPNQPSDYYFANIDILTDHLETLPGIIDPPLGRTFSVVEAQACTLQCVISPTVAIQRVWFRIFPPGFAGDPSAYLLPAGDMYATGVPGEYRGVYVDRAGFFEANRTYFPYVYATDESNRHLLPLVLQILPIVAASERDPAVWNDYGLTQNFPNPFNSATQFGLSLRTPGRVRITVWNLLGQRVAVLMDRPVAAGRHTVIWDGTTGGVPAASGVYVARIETDEGVHSLKMVLLR